MARSVVTPSCACLGSARIEDLLGQDPRLVSGRSHSWPRVTALELGRLDLTDALGLTALTALKDRPRSRRLAARWLERRLAEAKAPTIDDDAAMMVGLLAALGGASHEPALAMLRGLGQT